MLFSGILTYLYTCSPAADEVLRFHDILYLPQKEQDKTKTTKTTTTTTTLTLNLLIFYRSCLISDLKWSHSKIVKYFIAIDHFIFRKFPLIWWIPSYQDRKSVCDSYVIGVPVFSAMISGIIRAFQIVVRKKVYSYHIFCCFILQDILIDNLVNWFCSGLVWKNRIKPLIFQMFCYTGTNITKGHKFAIEIVSLIVRYEWCC